MNTFKLLFNQQQSTIISLLFVCRVSNLFCKPCDHST